MHAAQLLVQTLADHKVDRVFCVPGESYLPVLDALYDCPAIDVVTCRHEGSAGFMAVADAKMTRRPGVCFVSRGPGATNAAISVHVARQDTAPMVLFVGQVARQDLGCGAFQEVDYHKTFADLAKGVWQVERSDALAEIVARAFHMAQSGAPGPVVVALPEDMLVEETVTKPVAPMPVTRPPADDGEVGRVAALLRAAERPVLIAGPGLDCGAGRRALAACAETWSLAVAPGFKQQHLIAHDHPNLAGYLGYASPPALVGPLRDADLLIAVGTPLDYVTTQGFTLPQAPHPAQTLVHVYPDPAVVGRLFATDHGIVCDPVAFLEKLAVWPDRSIPEGRGRWVAGLHGTVGKLARWQPKKANDGVVFGALVAALAARVEPDAVLITDAGNFASWIHRYFPFGADHHLVGAITGAMGLGMPAAVALGLRQPERQIITFIGDGGFLMNGNELATAVARRVPVCVFVANNASYGTIRLHQEKAYPGRVTATDLTNPDFAALAESFGARGLTIAHDDDVASVVEAALRNPGPVVVDVRTSLNHISAYTTLTGLVPTPE